MILDLGSFAFGSSITTGGGTPSWGTSLGQSQPDYKFTYPGAEDMVLGMAYCAVPLEAVTLPLGKGGKIYKASDLHECVLASLFRKVYINGRKINHPFIMVLIKESSDSHNGRRSIKYSSKNAYSLGEESYSNLDFVSVAQNTLGISNEACWFVYKFEIINQDELHMSAIIVDSNENIEYESSAERKIKWQSLIPTKDAEEFSKIQSSLSPSTEPLQQIFYGAPGTGKSFKIDEETKKAGSDYVFRTTFHPDSDYSTFVGAYKPTMVRSPRYELCGSSAVLLTYNQKPLIENKIEYRFVKQAFTKAYIKAWKEFAQPNHTPAATPVMNGVPSASTRVEVNWDKITWVLKKVENSSIAIEKHEWSPINKFRDDVLKYWEKEFDSKLIGQGQLDVGNGAPFVPAACIWFYNNYCQDGKKNKEECLNTIMNELEAGRTIKGRPNSKIVCISLDGDKVCFYIPEEDCIKPQRTTIKKTYESSDDRDPSSVQSAIAAKLKTYNLPFDEAWDRLAQEVNGASDDEVATTASAPFDLNNVKPVYLIIEEINRGNCAQIFGDLFQLLDRSDYGFSCYPILSDEDIRQCLTAEDKNDDPSFGVNGLSFTEEQAALINSALKCDADDDVAEKIAQGEVLVLPPNLHIWATMNTSDQSLFPIDSAFKRRWDWTYVKITDGKKDWKVKGDGYSCDWWTFVQEVNKKIASATRSDDKKLGYFFCKPKQGNTFIDESTFVGKVIFYLWNDVFKDNDYSIFKVNASNGDPTFDDFYEVGKDGKIVPDSSSVKQFLINVVGQENMTIDGNAPQDQEQEQQSSTLSIEE